MRRAIACAVALGASSGALGQAFNVDYGSMFDPTAPSSEYGGAADQPGVWNDLPGFDFMPIPLLEVGGGETGVTVLDGAGNPPFGFPNPKTIGDDGALMDDALDLGADSRDVFVIEGLAPGKYDVFTYAWAPDSPTYVTGVRVNGQAEQLVGGDWQGEHALGFSYALHAVEIGEGEPIEIATSTFIGFATLNGFQVRPAGGCAADCNGDGELSVLDFVCFQNEWVGQSAAGDCDGSGRFDILDFVCFQGLFVQGCP
jgi:hypothetical protein